MNVLPTYLLQQYLRNPRNGYYSFFYNNLDNHPSFSLSNDIPKHELKFYELVHICRYSIDIGLLYYILISSDKKLEKLMIPHGSFVANAQIKQVFSLIDFNILTHLDIHIPILNDEMTQAIDDAIDKGLITHIGINPSIVTDTNNVKLMSHITMKTHITSISIYHKLFTTRDSVTSIFRTLRYCFYDHMMIELDVLRNLEGSDRGRSVNLFLWFLKTSKIKHIDAKINCRAPDWFYRKLFSESLERNSTLSELNIINTDIDVTNGLELMKSVYNNNYTLTHISFNFKERKRSVRLRQTNELIQSFCERNLNLAKRFKTLFEMMLESIDIKNFYFVNKRQKT